MNTGTKIALGVLGTGVLVGGAILLSHTVFRGHDTTTSCGPLVVGESELARMLSKAASIGNVSPRSSALKMVAKLFHAMFPSCDFDKTTTATITRVDGSVIEWQDVVELLGDRTIEDVQSDPEAIAAMNALGGMQREGSAGIVPDDSVGGSLKDMVTAWMGGPLG